MREGDCQIHLRSLRGLNFQFMNSVHIFIDIPIPLAIFVNNVHKYGVTMNIQTIIIIITLAATIVTPSFAGPSDRHSAQSVNHSALAASHGSAAVVSATSAVVAIPIILFGSSLAISGAALQEVGKGALELGTDQKITTQAVQPDAMPTLD